MTEDRLLDEIAESPDDPGPYLICADLLQQRGDARGDLIVVQHALESAGEDVALRRREAELIRAHRDAWFGAGTPAAGVVTRCRFGFVHAVRLLRADALEALFAIPHASSTLAELRLDGGLGDELPSVIASLARRWPRSLRRLYVAAADDVEPESIPPYSLAPIAEVAGRLDTLAVGGSRVELGGARLLATLRHVEARTNAASPPATEDLDAALAEASGALARAAPGEVRGHYTRVLELAEQRGGARLADRARTRFARRLPLAEARAELLAAGAAQIRRVERVDALAIGESFRELGDATAAEAWLWRAVTEAQLAGEPSGEGDAMHALGKLERKRANMPAAEASLRVALGIARAARDRRASARALSELARIACDRGEVAGAEQLFRSAIETRDGEPLETAGDQHDLAALLLDAGRLQAAHEVAVAAHESFDTCDDFAGIARAQALIGEIQRGSGDLVEARRWLDSSGEYDARAAQIYLARLANDLGDHAAARAHAQQASDPALQQLALADAALGDRQYAEARQCADRAYSASRSKHGRARARLRKGIASQLERAELDTRYQYEEALREAADHEEALGWVEVWLAAFHAVAYRAKQAADLFERACTRFPMMTHRTRDALVMVQALLENRGGHVGHVGAAVPGYVMALSLMDRVKGQRTPLPAPTTFETRLLARLDEP